MRNKVFNYLFLPLTWTLIVQILLVIPGKDLPKLNWTAELNIDKLVHFILYAGMTWLWCRYLLGKNGAANLSKKFVYIMLAVVANGVMMEFVQKYFIPGRSFDLFDILADTLGGIIGYLLIRRRLTKVMKGKSV